MKNRVILLLLSTMFITTSRVIAQKTPSAPPEITKNTNYADYNNKVKEYVAWYIKAPLDKDTALRREIASFLILWMTGSPDVTVSIGSVVSPIIGDKNNPYTNDLFIAYMGGVSVYELNNPNDKNEVNIETAGVQAVLEMGKNNSSLLAGDDAIKKYGGMNKDALAKFVKDCIAKDKKSK